MNINLCMLISIQFLELFAAIVSMLRSQIVSGHNMTTTSHFESVTTAELIADIKKQLAERRAQFERDYPVKVGA